MIIVMVDVVLQIWAQVTVAAIGMGHQEKSAKNFLNIILHHIQKIVFIVREHSIEQRVYVKQALVQKILLLQQFLDWMNPLVSPNVVELLEVFQWMGV